MPRDAPQQTLVEQAEYSVRPAPCGFLSFKRSAFEIRRYFGGRAHDRLCNEGSARSTQGISYFCVQVISPP
ncbi:hypothetical protein GCM10008919_17750 [Selenomonas dianae]|uniref:Uncharacterized protein n=1 Tax=Selenomonas dianae TaxID=135079 RepID=A0ABN0T851_9FIRM